MLNEIAVRTAIESIADQIGYDSEVLTELIIELEKKKLAWASLDKPYLYPAIGDTQKTCPMLDAMFYIEHHRGIILFLPFAEVKA